MGREEAPPDHFHLAWIIFLLMGIGSLFAWNVFLSAYDYWSLLYPSVPFQFIMAAIFNYPALFFLFLSIKFGPRFSFSSRIVIPFGIILVVLVAVPIVTHLLSPSISLWVVLSLVFLTGCTNAIILGAVFGLAAMFPGSYTAAIMGGNGVAGILACLIRIITKVSLPNDPSGLKIGASIYFGIAAFVNLLCIIGYIVLHKLPITTYYVLKAGTPIETHTSIPPLRGSLNAEEDEEPLLPTEIREEKPSIIHVLKKIWPHALTIGGVFIVTLGLYPGVTSLVTHHQWNIDEDWYQILLIGLFMVGDWLGRTIPSFPKLIFFSAFTNRIVVAVRFVFIPLFFFCVNPHLLPYWDFLPCILMFLFALSNGYTSTLTMMFAPQAVGDHEKEIAGTMMSFSLNVGIFLGTNIALGFLKIVNPSAPII